MTLTETISILNNLVETSKDGEKGFLDASNHAHAPKLRTLFSEFSAACGQSATELQACVRLLGGEAVDTGTSGAALHRGWMNLRVSLTSHEDTALLEECERGEDHAKTQYTKAMRAELAPSVRTLLQHQHEGTLLHHARIRELRNAARAAR